MNSKTLWVITNLLKNSRTRYIAVDFDHVIPRVAYSNNRELLPLTYTVYDTKKLMSLEEMIARDLGVETNKLIGVLNKYEVVCSR